MSRFLLFIPVIFCFSFLPGDGGKRFFYDDFVECFYPKGETEPLYIYDKHNGEVIDSLFDGGKYQWYKLTIKESKEGGWFCLEDLMQAPDHPVTWFSHYKGMWVHSEKLRLFVPDICCGIKVCFFEDHDQQSSVVYTAKDYLPLTLLEVWEDWAKVKFEVGGEKKEGWLMRNDQCGYPWTNCTRAGGNCN